MIVTGKLFSAEIEVKRWNEEKMQRGCGGDSKVDQKTLRAS